MIKNNTIIFIILIIFLGLFLRTWQISNLPFPPDGDEVAFGYYGWSLANFGTDEYGNKFPLSFTSIGDNKYPGLAYLNILPALIFGLSDITTRFWSVVSGILGIPLIYLFSFYITQNRRASLFSALLFAISPWSLIVSRIGYENQLAFITALSGIVLLLSYLGGIKSRRAKGRKAYLYVSLLLLIITVFTYAAQRIFVPMYLFFLFAYSFMDEKLAKSTLKILLVFLLISFVSISLFANPNFRGRADEEVWKFTREDFKRLEETYNASGISELRIHPRITWFLHNKYSHTAIEFSKRYLSHFSPSFLFFEGEASGEAIPGMGVLLLVEIILLPAGILFLFKDKKKWPLVFAWLILAPIPSSLTTGGAHINRASLMIVPISILSGYGFWGLTNFRSRKINILLTFILAIVVLWSFLLTLHQIFVVKPYYRPWYRKQVNRELTEKVLSLRGKYDAVAVNDDDYIFYLFYGKIPPYEFTHNAEIIALHEDRWERVERLYNIYFKMPFNCPLSGKEKVLYVCRGDEVPQNSRLIDLVYYKDGLPAYTLIEFYPLSDRPNPLPTLPERLHYMVDVEKPDGNPDGIIHSDADYLW